MSFPEPHGTCVMDLDGVVWLAERPIPGSAEAVDRLKECGMRVLFVTNNAGPLLEELVQRLSGAGIEADEGDVITSAQAAAAMLVPDSKAVVCGDEGLVQALTRRGVEVVREGRADAVVVGWTRKFDFEMLARASIAVRDGARFIGTNEDATHPTPERLLPGAGSILAAVATAAQATPEVAGKPHDPLVSLLREHAQDVSLVIGDRPSTDGLLARKLNVPFALVRSGVTRDGREPMVVEPDVAAEDLSQLVGMLLRSS